MSRADREELRALRARVGALELERRAAYREPFPWEDVAVLALAVPVMVSLAVLLFSIVGRVVS